MNPLEQELGADEPAYVCLGHTRSKTRRCCKAAAVQGTDELGSDSLDGVDSALDLVAIGRSEMEAAEDGVHAVDAAYLSGIGHRIDDPSVRTPSQYDESLAPYVDNERLIVFKAILAVSLSISIDERI